MHSWETHFTRGRVGFGTVNLPQTFDQAKANYFAPEGIFSRFLSIYFHIGIDPDGIYPQKVKHVKLPVFLPKSHQN